MSIRPFLHLLLFIVLGFTIYSGVVNAPFVFDDGFYIVDNPPVRELSSFLDFSGTRYIGLLSFAVNYAIGAFDVTGYNLTNIGIHIINAFLVYMMILLLARTQYMKGFLESAPGLPLLAGLIFLTHPVESQAVCYVTQRFASLATLFYLASIVFYLSYRLGAGGRKGRNPGGAFFYLLSLASCIIAQKTKEISFTLPAMIVFCEFTFFAWKERKVRTHIKALSPFLLTLLIIPLTLLLSAAPEIAAVGGEIEMVGAGGSGAGAASVVRGYQVRELMELSSYEYFSTQLRVIVTYLRLLILPVGQNLLYDYPKYTTILTFPVLLSLAFLSLFLLAVLALFVTSRGGRSPVGLLGAFGGLWFFITLSIESSVIPIKHLIFEHRLYLPSIGAIILFSAFLIFIIKRLPVGIFLKPKRVPLIFTVIITIILSLATYRRSLVWADELTLWDDVVKKSPGLSTAHNNYAKAVEAAAGNKELAMKHYLEAVRLSPTSAVAHNNIGRLYYEDGDTVMAVKHYNLALSFNPTLAEAHNNIANLYIKRGDDEAALFHYKEALRLKPGNSDILFSIARYYQLSGDSAKAIASYSRAISLSPWHYRSHYALAVIYQGMEDNAKAISHYKEAIDYKPELTEAHYNIAAVYINEGDLGAAIIHYKECIRLEPGNHDYHFNLAWAYQSASMYDEAITEYKEAVKLDPNIKETRFNLGLAYRSRNKIVKAMGEFKEALRIDPGYKEASEAIKSDLWGDELNGEGRQGR